jgi:hypothetical protein
MKMLMSSHEAIHKCPNDDMLRLQTIYSDFYQCCGSVTFWYGFGSSEPKLCLTDPDEDPGGPEIRIRIRNTGKKS